MNRSCVCKCWGVKNVPFAQITGRSCLIFTRQAINSLPIKSKKILVILADEVNKQPAFGLDGREQRWVYREMIAFHAVLRGQSIAIGLRLIEKSASMPRTEFVFVAV